jgi:hypothetical protein
MTEKFENIEFFEHAHELVGRASLVCAWLKLSVIAPHGCDWSPLPEAIAHQLLQHG